WYSGRLSSADRISVFDWLDAKYALVPTVAPTSVTPPVVGGTLRDGAAATASTGTWTSPWPIAYAYQWQRCDASGTGCTALTGATASSYSAVSADVGSTLRVVVAATNKYGNATATSPASAQVAPAPPVSSSAPAVLGTT